MELPPTGYLVSLVFAVLPQAGKDLSLQAGFLLMTGELVCLSFLRDYYLTVFQCVFNTAFTYKF